MNDANCIVAVVSFTSVAPRKRKPAHQTVPNTTFPLGTPDADIETAMRAKFVEASKGHKDVVKVRMTRCLGKLSADGWLVAEMIGPSVVSKDLTV